MRQKYTAIVLAAGRGSRMNSDVCKQFMDLDGYPVLYYSLRAFEQSGLIHEIILVTGEDDISYCRAQIVEKYGFHKVSRIVAGGSERYLSVYEGLKAAGTADVVLIHDGARPFVTEDIMRRTIEAARQNGSGVAAMPVKDTIKLADEQQFVTATPPRERLWMIQTPQTFSYPKILAAYEQAIAQGLTNLTDDAMVMEQTTGCRVKLVEGSYRNIKVTTPEDMDIALNFCKICKKGY